MLASFIICLTSSRINNLIQQLYFLNKRESCIKDCELIVIWNDKILPIQYPPFKRITQGLSKHTVYNKPYLINLGVSYASSDKLIILDNDRILPINYFTNSINLIKKNQVLSTTIIKKLLHDVSNEQIESNNFEYKYDYRSTENKMHQKNMFSGNTIMWYKDYIKLGGMDENFIGYGFNDNDFTMKLMTNKMDFIWLNETELHLYHEYFCEKQKLLNTIENVKKYCLKWHLEIPNSLIETALKENIILNKYYIKL